MKTELNLQLVENDIGAFSFKTIKSYCTGKYDDQLNTEGVNKETEARNLKPPPRKEIIKYILDAWAVLLSKVVKELFILCTLSLPTNGLRDDRIHWFKEGQLYFQGSEVLRSQLMIMKDE